MQNNTRQNIKYRIAAFIRTEHQDPALVLDGVQLIETGILDSFFLIALTDFLEREFQIPLTADDLREENFATLERVTDLVSRRLRNVTS